MGFFQYLSRPWDLLAIFVMKLLSWIEHSKRGLVWGKWSGKELSVIEELYLDSFREIIFKHGAYNFHFYYFAKSLKSYLYLWGKQRGAICWFTLQSVESGARDEFFFSSSSSSFFFLSFNLATFWKIRKDESFSSNNLIFLFPSEKVEWIHNPFLEHFYISFLFQIACRICN